MSMVHEDPSNYIKDGKIYSYKRGRSYHSLGYSEHDPDTTQFVCDDSDDARAQFIEKNIPLFDYNTLEYVEKVNEICKDNFGNSIYNGSRIVFNDDHYDGTFKKYSLGTVVGSTEYYIKIIPDNKELLKRTTYRRIRNEWVWVNYEVPYILRYKDKQRFVLIRKLK